MPSLTIPDQSLSIKEILARYARNQPLHVAHYEPIYDGEDNELPDPRTMDLVDRAEMAESVREQLSMFNNQKPVEQLPKQSAPAPANPVERGEVEPPPTIS